MQMRYGLVAMLVIVSILGTLGIGEGSSGTEELRFSLYCLQGDTEAWGEELYANVAMSDPFDHEDTGEYDEALNTVCNSGAELEHIDFLYNDNAYAEINVFENDLSPNSDDVIDVRPSSYGSGCYIQMTFDLDDETFTMKDGGQTTNFGDRIVLFGSGESGCTTDGAISFGWDFAPCSTCNRN